MSITADIRYNDGFIRLSETLDNRYFVTCSFGDDESTTETTHQDIIDTIREAHQERENGECTISLYDGMIYLS